MSEELFDVDFAKWTAPATKGDVANVMQYLRGITIHLLGVQVALAKDDRDSVLKRIDRVLEADEQFMTQIRELVGKEAKKGG